MNDKNWPYTTRPERTVTGSGVSPMNPKVKWAQLDCGHDVYCKRRPRLGATLICERCAEKAGRKP
jgi:hypothetical protein